MIARVPETIICSWSDLGVSKGWSVKMSVFSLEMGEDVPCRWTGRSKVEEPGKDRHVIQRREG